MQKRLSAVVSPQSPVHPDREVDCLLALVRAFRGLVETAEDAGWTEKEVASSLLALVYVYENKMPEKSLCH
jgi:hypothetical protein